MEAREMRREHMLGRWFIAGRFFTSTLALVLGFSTTAQARIHIGRSLEWMTVDAPFIVRGVVTDVHTTKGVFVEQPLWDVQEVTIAIHETLKGSPQQTVTFRWLNSGYESAESWKADGHERLFFLTHGASDYYGVDFRQDWVLYGGYPDVPVNLVTVAKVPVAADMTVPKTAEQILGKIKARLEQAAKAKLPMVSRPDVHVGFDAPNGAVQLEVLPENSEAYAALWSGSACFLIVPADERYQLEALQMIRSNDYTQRLQGIDILSAYPSDDTINMLKDLLSDPGTHEETQYSFDGKEHKKEKYGVREFAWQALKRLGVDVPQPVLEK